MGWQPIKKSGKFIHCPNCHSTRILQTDYEGEDGEEDTDGRACDECDWEGDDSELVSTD